jgi:alpha-beta hydrolase superfamily lysophospholipase
VPIEGARHDVFLSQAAARTRAYEAVDAWLGQHRFAPAAAEQ